MPDPTVKPGWKTTEFWLTLAGQTVAILVVVGVVKPSEQPSLSDSLTRGVEAVFALLVSGATILSYVSGRVRLKDK